MAFDYFSILSNGVGSDGVTTESEAAVLGISYGFITDALGESTVSAIQVMLKIGRAGVNFARGVLRIGR